MIRTHVSTYAYIIQNLVKFNIKGSYSEGLLQISLCHVHWLICKKLLRLRYIKLFVKTFVMIIRRLSQERSILNEIDEEI